MGGLGAGDGGSAKNLQRSHAVHSCLPPAAPPPPSPRRPVDMPATPLSSHVGCRLLGTLVRLPVRVVEGWWWWWWWSF